MQPSGTRGAEGLGGRLPLLAPADLDDQQRHAYDLMGQLILPEAEAGGFTVKLGDGSFIGPFNALLHVPGIAAGMGAWASQLNAFGIADDVRQVVVLTVAAAWGADYELEAHSSAARAVGVPDDAIKALIDRRLPQGLTADATTAHLLIASLLTDRTVSENLYARAVAAFGEAGVVALLCLLGQYQVVCSILRCFEVPALVHSAAS